MRLTDLIRKVLLEQVNPLLQQLKEKYVGEGKPLTEEEFTQIQDVASNKWFLIAWLTKRVVSNLIKKEDIYKWKEYFEIYEKNKNKFQHKDINLYKTAEDLQNLINNVIEVREGGTRFEDIQSVSNFLSKKEIEKIESGNGIKYIGVWKPKVVKDLNKDGYQVFEVRSVTKDNWKLYRDMLGRCKGRERGAKIDICTIANYEYFKRYLKEDKGSSYFVLFNLNDPLSPYQLHIESQQFMNKNDAEKYNFPILPFYLWLVENTPNYSLDKLLNYTDLEIPSKEKGYTDEKGKQGEWLTYEGGRLRGKETYVNDKLNGPYEKYYRSGRVSEVGTYKNGLDVGDYVYYDSNGDILEKGNISKRGQKQGEWLERIYMEYIDTPVYVKINYSEPQPLSGFTSDGKLRIVSDATNIPRILGDVVSFHETGQPKAIGKLTKVNGIRTGNWTFFFADGSIRAEGKFTRDDFSGPWTFVFKRKNKKYIYTINFDERGGNANEKGRLYDAKGQFIKKLKINDSFLPNFQLVTQL